jgi:hypothetical protein
MSTGIVAKYWHSFSRHRLAFRVGSPGAWASDNGRHQENIICFIRFREIWVCYSWSRQWLPGQQGSKFSGTYPGNKVISENLHNWHYVSEKLSPKSNILLNASWTGACGKWDTVTLTIFPALSPQGSECSSAQLWGDQVRFTPSASFQQGMSPQTGYFDFHAFPRFTTCKVIGAS